MNEGRTIWTGIRVVVAAFLVVVSTSAVLAAGGNLFWTADARSSGRMKGIAATGDVVRGLRGRNVFAVSAKTGESRWNVPATSRLYGQSSDMTARRGRVFPGGRISSDSTAATEPCCGSPSVDRTRMPTRWRSGETCAPWQERRAAARGFSNCST